MNREMKEALDSIQLEQTSDSYFKDERKCLIYKTKRSLRWEKDRKITYNKK